MPWTFSPVVPRGRHRRAGKTLPIQHHMGPASQVPSCARPKLSTLQACSPCILGCLAEVGLSEPRLTDVAAEGLNQRAGQDEVRKRGFCHSGKT